MARKNSRYMMMEKCISLILLADTALFIGFLVVAGKGILWAKILLAVLALLVSAAVLGYLYLSQELLRRRSLWMSTAAAAIVLCTLFSILLNFPRPKYELEDAEKHFAQSTTESTTLPTTPVSN